MNHPLRLTVALAALALGYAAGIPGDASADEATHEALIGKRAPDFDADFAAKGKPVKVADFKGKVVLLTFWAAWSGPSRTVMARLQDWSNDYKLKGLEVVGVTVYNSDFKRHLVFDKQNGKVIEAKKTTTRATDQQLLRDFAAYYKLDYPLLKLPLDEAKQVYKVYGVSRIPQFVVIDRKGVVRMIRVGASSEKLDAVYDEVKTLLEER